MEVDGWVQVSLGFLVGKSSQDISTDSLGYYAMCIVCVNMVFKVVTHIIMI